MLKLYLIGFGEVTFYQIMKLKHPKEYSYFLKEVRDYIDCIRISDLAKVCVKNIFISFGCKKLSAVLEILQQQVAKRLHFKNL